MNEVTQPNTSLSIWRLTNSVRGNWVSHRSLTQEDRYCMSSEVCQSMHPSGGPCGEQEKPQRLEGNCSSVPEQVLPGTTESTWGMALPFFFRFPPCLS